MLKPRVIQEFQFQKQQQYLGTGFQSTGQQQEELGQKCKNSVTGLRNTKQLEDSPSKLTGGRGCPRASQAQACEFTHAGLNGIENQSTGHR